VGLLLLTHGKKTNVAEEEEDEEYWEHMNFPEDSDELEQVILNISPGDCNHNMKSIGAIRACHRQGRTPKTSCVWVCGCSSEGMASLTMDAMCLVVPHSDTPQVPYPSVDRSLLTVSDTYRSNYAEC
jgi:hypothetical protein